jgi:ribosomal protein S18 acetylase RimI-like enzyme
MKLFHLKFLIISLLIPFITANSFGKKQCDSFPNKQKTSTRQPFNEFISKAGKNITIERIIDGCMKDEENVFLEAFSTIYENLIKKGLLHIQGPLNIFLQNAFDQEKKRLIKKYSTDYFFSAKFEGAVVGYISFSNDNEANTMYINQLAVVPKFSNQGIGKALVFSIFTQLPNTKRLVVITRKINKNSIHFYEKLGFHKSEYMRSGYDSNLYVGYEYFKNS